MSQSDARKRITGAIMRLRSKAAFFAVLAMHADYREDSSIPTAATDGRNIYYNPEFINGLSKEELLGVLLHEVLHCAFAHIPRQGQRDHEKWNYACDYVINPMVLELDGAELPEKALLDYQYEGRRVEEVYDMLPDPERIKVKLPAAWFDLRPGLDDSQNQQSNSSNQSDSSEQQDKSAAAGAAAEAAAQEASAGSSEEEAEGQDSDNSSDGGGGGDRKQSPAGKAARNEELSRYWRQALNGAVQAHKISSGQGSLPRGAELLLNELNEPEVDWRELLWEYTVHHPHDFGEFDMRLVGRRIYEEALEGESLELHIGVDTSGSCIGWVTPFISELNGILQAFPHVKAQLSYVDASLIGPFEVEQFADIPPPKGGGGTSFVPFFKHIEEEADPFGNQVLLYLTDGYGTFPDVEPQQDTIWVVPPGGLASEHFPFGRVIRLQLDH